MKELEITREELDEVRMLHAKENRGMPVSFSINNKERIWLSPGSGLIAPEKREYVEHLSNRLVEIGRRYVNHRDDRERAGGKFFIDWDGAFWKDEDAKPHRFICWKSNEPLQPTITQPTWAELREKQRAAANNRSR
jgi:hypothetical protein